MQANGGSYDKFVDGHAWLSVTRDGKTQYYGLWPDDHPRVKDNGDGTDIRIGLEKGFRSSADRYYELNPAQVTKLDEALRANVAWSPTTTCAGWASDTVSSVTGKKLAASEFLSIETPRKLAETISKLEAKEPTAPDRPHAPIQQQGTSNSFRDESAPVRPDTQSPTAPDATFADPCIGRPRTPCGASMRAWAAPSTITAPAWLRAPRAWRRRTASTVSTTLS